MSSQNRRNKRLSEKHFGVLGDLLSNFYAFLASTPQPTDEMVRQRFIADRTKWTNYCVKHELSAETRGQFVKQVSLVWKKKLEESEAKSQKTE